MDNAYIRRKRQRRVRYPVQPYLSLYSITGIPEQKSEQQNKHK